MGLENAVLVLDEIESERIEWKRRPEPHVSCSARIEIGLEMLSQLPADPTVDSVRGDDQIRIDIGDVVDLSAETKLDAELTRSLLENIEELLPRYSAESVSARSNPAFMDEHIDVIPVGKVVCDRLIG
jgi:hypothetical protein